MSDRELLRLAAKAADLSAIFDTYGWCEITDGAFFDANEPPTIWNPLTDDGDALRLAVKLRIHVRHFPHDVEAQFERDYWHEFDEPDPYAATRRAIVRAAAEIGRTL